MRSMTQLGALASALTAMILVAGCETGSSGDDPIDDCRTQGCQEGQSCLDAGVGAWVCAPSGNQTTGGPGDGGPGDGDPGDGADGSCPYSTCSCPEPLIPCSGVCLDIEACEVMLPPGTFTMGYDPQHSVALTRGFYIDAVETTQGAWRELMGENPSSESHGLGETLPVNSITWYEALQFANARSAAEGYEVCYDLSGCTERSCPVRPAFDFDCEGFRLPTEAEWEYAARDGTEDVYEGGDCRDRRILSQAWTACNSNDMHHAVGTKRENARGMHDTFGSVAEWTWDSLVLEGSATDPVGLWPDFDKRTARGSHFGFIPPSSGIAVRETLLADRRYYTIGVRLVRTAQNSGFDPCSNQSNCISVLSVSAGGTHTCAVLQGGEVRCWGLNDRGQLGDGTLESGPAPVSVQGLSNVIAVSLGETPRREGAYTCALLESGEVRCWGLNDRGQLGDGTLESSPTPVSVQGLSDAIAVSAGGAHTCAVLQGGEVRCWGINVSGRLGDGSLESNSPTPVSVQGLSDAIAVSAGGTHTCAVLQSGEVRCWGFNSDGQLGGETAFGSSLTPVSVQGLSDATAVSVGDRHTCALLESGDVRCWGWNRDGQLGDGTTTDSKTPVGFQELSDVTAISTGEFHTCVVLQGGEVQCWGINVFGQLGYSTMDRYSALPLSVQW